MGCCASNCTSAGEATLEALSSRASKRKTTVIEIRINPPSEEGRGQTPRRISLSSSDDRPPSVDIDYRNFVTATKANLNHIYKVEKLIGEGASGFVYEGRHRVTGELRAIKTINRRNLNDLQQESIRREVEILKTLVKGK
jgi:serine/threonine protein kinase